MDPIQLEHAIEKRCKNLGWLIWILFLTATPISFNASHLASYVFLGGNPSFSCNIPELALANWTKEQIREISSPRLEKQSCYHFAWNYSFLKDLGYEEALSYYNITQKPDLIKCNSYIYEENTINQTIISEWDLVCEDMALRPLAQSSVAVGKFTGAVLFGLISDRFGRRKTFICASAMYMFGATSAAFVNSYKMFILFRLVIGLAGAGVYDVSYTILMELTVKAYRVYLGNIFNIAYSFGIVYLPVAAYLTNNWRQLQLVISIPLFALIIHCWFLPESPRWLIAKGKIEKVTNIIGSVRHLDYNEPLQPKSPDIETLKSDFWCKKVLLFFKDYFKIFSTFELAKRTLICYYLSFMGDFYYYILALNGTNFGVDPYLYMGLNGIMDLPACLLPIIFLTYFGRKSSAILLYSLSGIAMLALLVLPQGWPIMSVTLIGRLTGIAATGIFAFFTVELFPTESRNTAVGSCVAMSQLGPLFAPYVVEIGRVTFWWIPTVLSGSFAFLGAFLLMFVPETRNSPLLDTIKEMKKQEKAKNCKNPDSAI